MSAVAATEAPRRGLGLAAAGTLLGGVFVLGLLLGLFGVEGLKQGGVGAFKAIAGAHYRLYLARENLTEDGEAEFALLLGTSGAGALQDFMARHPDWRSRESLVPGWVVVTVPAGTPDALATLRAQGFARAVLRNRGMWICH